MKKNNIKELNTIDDERLIQQLQSSARMYRKLMLRAETIELRKIYKAQFFCIITELQMYAVSKGEGYDEYVKDEFEGVQEW